MNACQLVKQFGPLAGRIMLALIFLISGYAKIGDFSASAGYMASKGIPFAEVALALAIFLFVIPATLIFHNFWAMEAAQFQSQLNHFLKNVCILGGMLYIMAYGSGPLSLERDDC